MAYCDSEIEFVYLEIRDWGSRF